MRATNRNDNPTLINDWLLLAVILLAALVLLFVDGCAPTPPQVIIVEDDDPVQIREDILAAPVWVFDRDGDRVEAFATLPAGWYCLPMPADDADKATATEDPAR